jgi:hypothetical protein
VSAGAGVPRRKASGSEMDSPLIDFHDKDVTLGQEVGLGAVSVDRPPVALQSVALEVDAGGVLVDDLPGLSPLARSISAGFRAAISALAVGVRRTRS